MRNTASEIRENIILTVTMISSIATIIGGVLAIIVWSYFDGFDVLIQNLPRADLSMRLEFHPQMTNPNKA